MTTVEFKENIAGTQTVDSDSFSIEEARELLSNIMKDIVGKSCIKDYRVEARKQTWQELYPNWWARLRARTYNLLSRFSGRTFPKTAFSLNVFRACFPFKMRLMDINDISELLGKHIDPPVDAQMLDESHYIKFYLPTPEVIVDLHITPCAPVEYIEFEVTVTNQYQEETAT